jgi:hypothetical protein
MCGRGNGRVWHIADLKGRLLCCRYRSPLENAYAHFRPDRLFDTSRPSPSTVLIVPRANDEHELRANKA